jgi:major membrane immunogen (membrane-anchored lipoprotein)
LIAVHEMRTVLLAESLTPEDLYDAMSACRGYGTLDKNLEIRYTLDGAVMGSNLSAADGTYTASIQIFDPDGLKDEITLVEIISDRGEIVASIPTSRSSVDLTVDLDSEDARYFYVRVTTASPLEGEEAGVTAWTSPVWTGR